MNVAESCLDKARQYLQENNYGRAFAHYLVVLQLLDQCEREDFKEEFLFTWSLWKDNLFENEKYENLISCFDLVESYFPGKGIQELNHLGVLLLKSNKFKNARTLLQAAHLRNPNNLPVEQNLQSTKNALVERWHFRMLNDQLRNNAYFEAITTEITKGYNNVLDIGMGTSIFSLYASKYAKRIIACDDSEIMVEIANKIVEMNSASNVKILNVHSSGLTVPNMGNKVNLVITEVIDSGIFGEHILETLIHAWENLLEPQGKVIPSRVEVYITGVSSNIITSKFRSKTQILNLSEICITSKSEPYDTVNLWQTPFKCNTDTQMCLNIDFNSVTQLKNVLKTAKHNPKIKLTVQVCGQIESFAIWFKLYLNDKIYISNDPRKSTISCWEQAIINLKHPIIVTEKNETLQIQISCTDSCLKISELTSNFQDIIQHVCFDVSKDEIYILNDCLLLQVFENITKVIKENVKILDLGKIPILGLLLLQKGAQLYCQVSQETKILIQHISDANKLNFSNIYFLSDFIIPDIKFDIIYQNLVSSNGLLNENAVLQTRHLFNYLIEDGVFYPQKVFVWAQLIFCDWLENVTKVDDKNVCGVKIAEVINEFKTTEQRDLNTEVLNCTYYTEPIKIGLIEFDTSKPLENTKDVKVIKNGCPNAILYWFEVNFIEDMSLSTKRCESFANNAAVMLESDKIYNTGDIIHLKIKQHDGLLKMFISE